MTRTMFDSVTVGAIPPTAQLIGCYVDGRYVNVGQARQRFPHATIVTITVLGAAGAHVCDCETGDLTPPHAAQWAAREHQAGRHPTIYCNASTWPAVRAEVAKTELKPADVSYWIAQYDNQPHIPAGAVAKQYIDRGPHGENVDISVVADYWPGVDPAPKPPAPPTPAPSEETTVRLYIIDGTKPVWITDGIQRRWVQNPAERDQIEKDFALKVITLPKGSTFLNDIPIVGPAPK